MHSSRRVSKPVLALVVVSLFFTGLVCWTGLHRRAKLLKSRNDVSWVAAPTSSSAETNSDESAGDLSPPSLQATAPRPPLRVEGRVLDSMDRPIAGALVRTSIWEPQQEARTDGAGKFQFRFGANGGPVMLDVKAKGYIWTNEMILAEQGMDEIVFRLLPAKTVRGIVRNESGEPIPGVHVSAFNEADEVTTDKDGRFEWDTASSGILTANFTCEGYVQIHHQWLDPSVENVIVLRKTRQMQGLVLDAATGRPITKFRTTAVRVGLFPGSSGWFPDVGSMTEHDSADGSFTVELHDPEDNGIQAEADDYSEKVEKIPEITNGLIQIVLRLKPSAALEAVVVTPDGTPVGGATVTLGEAQPGGRGIPLSRGQIQRGWQMANRIVVTTDDAGRFKLSSLPESGLLLATADSGFGLETIEQVRTTGRLTLKPFGRIEGTFTRGGQAVAGQNFVFQFLDANVFIEDQSASDTTDREGRFTIDKLPPGEGRLLRTVESYSSSSVQFGGISQCADVVIESGQATRVSIGDTGATLKGHVSFDTPPDDAAKLLIRGMLVTPVEKERAHLDSAEWKEVMKHHKYFFVPVAEDGTYTADLIPPGNYTLIVSASQHGPQIQGSDVIVAEGKVMVAVPENASPDAPIELGELILTAVALPR